MPAADLIDQRNPKIRDWANYHRHMVSKRAFGGVDRTIFSSLWQWARRRHPNKSPRWFNRNTLNGVETVTGPSSVKPAMTKGGQVKSGCTTPRALPSNATSRSKAKLTPTISSLKPTSKNAKGLTCWKRFGVTALFVISGMNNVDSARSAIQKSLCSQAG